MRIFFPGLLLLVSLIVFVYSGWMFHWHLRLQFDPSILFRQSIGISGQQLEINFILLELLLSSWTATWAWKEIQRAKMGRIE